MGPLPDDVARGPQKESRRSSFLYLRQYKAERIVYGRLEEGQREESKEGSAWLIETVLYLRPSGGTLLIYLLLKLQQQRLK